MTLGRVHLVVHAHSHELDNVMEISNKAALIHTEKLHHNLTSSNCYREDGKYDQHNGIISENIHLQKTNIVHSYTSLFWPLAGATALRVLNYNSCDIKTIIAAILKL